MPELRDILNKIHNADCVDFLQQIPDNSIDLVVTSPPYNLGIEYDSWNDNMSWDDYYNWCRQWMKELYRVLKEDGRFCLNHYLSLGKGAGKSNNTMSRQSPLMDLNWIAVKEIGFKHHSIAIWTDITLSKKTAFGSWLSASAPYISCPYEGILILYKTQWKKLNKGTSTIDKENFVSLTRGIWNIGTVPKGLTPANFPKKLAASCINLLSYVGDTVLDPFSGSGTTCIVAKELKRNFIGIEISKNYWQISNDEFATEKFIKGGKKGSYEI